MTGEILGRPDAAALRRDVEGWLLLPGEDGYDARRSVWNAMVDRRPALIAGCTSPADVAAAVAFGRVRELDVGVLCGGHSVLGIAVSDGGLMLDLTPMAAVRVDPDRRRAWVQGGALLGALDRATQPFGLATTAGNVSHTGVGGLTLGGGMGWLARAYGLSCDNVASYQVVTADGDLVRASESENADLFWGLRGGGGNFGVVTEFEFRLHPVGTATLITELYYRSAEAPAAMRIWRDLLADAPRPATFTAWVGTTADQAFLPSELHGQPMASLGYVWVGDPGQGRGLLDALRAAVPPAAERVEELSYLALQTMDDSPEGHRWRRYWKGHYLPALGDEAIDAFLSRGVRPGDGTDPTVLPYASLQAYGGAIAEVGEEATAFSHRDTAFEYVCAARWDDPAEDADRIAAARRYAGSLTPYAIGQYVNTITDEGVGRAYTDTKLARLTALKDRYDPDNVFHLNHNIVPTPR
jgi:FAD/FMN-containing dehydrogenase